MNKSSTTRQPNDDVAVSVRNVSKKFCKTLRRSMAYGIADLSRNLAGLKPDTARLRKGEFWALDDVSFELRRGEVLGLIGSNGSGKTTLLRLVAGIFPPDRGDIAMRGRVGALIALGAGFHPHMTGRENTYLNATILGMSHSEIEEKFDEIADFAEIGDFIDAPVSTYSSGMRVRLGFSIAINIDPEILLVDEVLAVGDVSFREKCMRRIDDIRSSDKAVLFVTHSLYQVEALCDRAIWLERGRVVANGAASEVVRRYLDAQEEKAMAESAAEGRGRFEGRITAAERAYLDARQLERTSRPARKREQADLVQIEGVELLDGNGEPRTDFPFASPMTVRIRYHARRRIERPLFNLRVLCMGRGILEASMLIDGHGPDCIEGRGVVECHFDRLPLTPKVYDILLFVRSAEGMTDIATMRTCARFQVTADGIDKIPLRGPMAINHLRQGSVVYLPRTWRFYDGNDQLTCTLESEYDDTE